MTDTSVEVLAVDGDHNLGGADWDARLFKYLKEQTLAQTGFEDIDEDEGALQDLRRMAEETKQALSKAESKTVAHRLAGKPAKIVVTRAQFQEMTADLLEKTAEITSRMLGDAETRFPGIKGQISELLLVGGSSWMPAVAERLRAEFPWKPKVADPDLVVAKGAALYAAGQTDADQVADVEGQDRVVAIFGHGGLHPRERVLAKVAQMKAEDIWFVTRGLGSAAAQEFAEVSSEGEPSVAVNGVDELAEGIATMAATLKSVTGRPRG